MTPAVIILCMAVIGAARQGKFWLARDLLFDRISQWRTLKDVKPFFSVIAKNAGLDADELARCVAGDEALSVIRAERAVGGSSFVQATPAYFINGDIVVGVYALQETLEKLFSARWSPQG
jgi:protein-disulfide isomerase